MDSVKEVVPISDVLIMLHHLKEENSIFHASIKDVKDEIIDGDYCIMVGVVNSIMGVRIHFLPSRVLII